MVSDGAPVAGPRAERHTARQGVRREVALMLLRESSLDAVRVSCIDAAKRNRWRSVVPVLQERQNKRGLSIAMKTAIANALDLLRQMQFP